MIGRIQTTDWRRSIDLSQCFPGKQRTCFEDNWRKAMKQMSIGKVAIATATFACTALLSVGWSEQRGVSLGVESAQARIGRPLTPFSVAGVARRQYRRAAYGYGYGAGLVGAGVAAAAIGTAAAASSWGYYGGGYPGYYGDFERHGLRPGAGRRQP